MSGEETPHEQRMMLGTGCHAAIPGLEPSYGYFPSQAAGIVFIVLFGLSTIGHIYASFKGRHYWYLCFAIGTIAEMIGWGGRIWSSQCPYNDNAFLMQISTLIFAPAFFTGGIYYILKQFIDVTGRQYSLIKPSLYLWIFIGVDVLSLALQAAGGGLASSASNEVGGDTATGTNIMVAGVIFQMASITVFCVFYAAFLWRSRNIQIAKAIMWLTYATVLSVTCIYIRSIYRTIELLQGWDGYLITTERFFIALDGAMMVIAVGVYNIVHPALLLPRPGEKIAESSIDEEAAGRIQPMGKRETDPEKKITHILELHGKHPKRDKTMADSKADSTEPTSPTAVSAPATTEAQTPAPTSTSTFAVPDINIQPPSDVDDEETGDDEFDPMEIASIGGLITGSARVYPEKPSNIDTLALADHRNLLYPYYQPGNHNARSGGTAVLHIADEEALTLVKSSRRKMLEKAEKIKNTKTVLQTSTNEDGSNVQVLDDGTVVQSVLEADTPVHQIFRRGANCLIVTDPKTNGYRLRYIPPKIAPDNLLLSLIHYNVIRAFLTNLQYFNIPLTELMSDEVMSPFCTSSNVPGNLPSTLYPTAMQMLYPHHPYIDLFPCSTARDNMIMMLTRDKDMVEEAICDDLCCTEGESGLVVWGPPERVESWEITPSFASKWCWLIKGCHELQRATNKWREARGDLPIRFEEINDM
ncbi:hypothetical protein Dda_9323 [Drechslerella dactyloides]|uniref:Uncharacterized protein n=1 Tax=Drechslerella dactyloides TaxID=74499 RepID=A0AAD6NF56_DREDA|nr:hypothetical protein Dda_9323 [Drechslerella dactyloides]